MKKLLPTLLIVAFVLLLIISMAFPVSADTYSYVDETDQYGTGTISTTHHAYSTFSLEIPLTLDTAGYGEFVASNPNLEDDYQIEVHMTGLNEDGTFDMIADDGSGETAQFYVHSAADFGAQLTAGKTLIVAFDAADFDAETMEARATVTISAVDSSAVRAGTYSGILYYRVECNPTNE